MEKFGEFCLGVILFVISAIVSTYIFYCYYNWFMSPVFNIKELTLRESLYVSTFIGFLKVKITKDDDQKDKSFSEKMIYIILVNLFLLGFGYLVHLI